MQTPTPTAWPPTQHRGLWSHVGSCPESPSKKDLGQEVAREVVRPSWKEKCPPPEEATGVPGKGKVVRLSDMSFTHLLCDVWQVDHPL